MSPAKGKPGKPPAKGAAKGAKAPVKPPKAKAQDVPMDAPKRSRGGLSPSAVESLLLLARHPGSPQVTRPGAEGLAAKGFAKKGALSALGPGTSLVGYAVTAAGWALLENLPLEYGLEVAEAQAARAKRAERRTAAGIPVADVE